MENRDEASAPTDDTETLAGDDGRRVRRGLVVPADGAARDEALPDVLGLLGEHTSVPLSIEVPTASVEGDPSLTTMALPPPPPLAALAYPPSAPSSSSMRVVRRKIRKLGGPDADPPAEAAPAEVPEVSADDAPTAVRLPRVTAATDDGRAVAKGSPLVVAVSRTPVPPVARPIGLDLIKPTPIPSPPVPRVQAISADDFSVPEADAPAEPVVGRVAAPRRPRRARRTRLSRPAGAAPAQAPVDPAGDTRARDRRADAAAPARGAAGVGPGALLDEVTSLPPSAFGVAPESDGVELSIDDGGDDEVERLSVPEAIGEAEGQEARSGRNVSLLPPPPEVAKAPPKIPSRASAVTVVDAKRKRRYWWEELFSEDYFRTLPRLDREQVLAEVDWIEQALGTEAGASILDLACGPGHHAIELALRRYDLTGLDLSPAMINRAQETAAAAGAEVHWAQIDMVQMEFEDAFDAAYCVGTSFGLFDDERNADVARRLHRALKPHGTFLMQVLNRDHVIQRQPAMAWFEGDGCVCMEETSFNFITSRLNVTRTMIFDDGRQREIEYSVRLYSLHELGQVLHQAGFRILEVSGHPRTPGAFFGATSRELIILAQKRGAEVVEIPSPLDPQG
ncbi:MAG: methyltransferase domain-containing protein [Polyangiales bacterium]